MKLFDLKKMAAVSALGLAFLMGMSETSMAQNRGSDRDWQRQQRIEQERARAEQERIEQEQERQAEMDRRNDDRRHDGRGNNGRGNDNRSWGNNNNGNNNRRYRVNRNGSYYNTDGRGAELLRQAVRSGYEQGFRAGQNDRNSRRRSNWSGNRDYRSGSYGYDSHVARNQYQYYFQQGFQRGYQDGFSRRNQYGSYNTNNGGGGILSSILSQILNIQTY